MMYLTDTGQLKEEPENFETRIAFLKGMIAAKQTKEQQRDNLLRYIAALLGIDDKEFKDFLNNSI